MAEASRAAEGGRTTPTAAQSSAGDGSLKRSVTDAGTRAVSPTSAPAITVSPRGDTNGGPGYSIRDEIDRHPYLAGSLGMALSGPDTGGSQWFVTHSPQPHLDGTYTVFGRVVRGMEVADDILPGDRIIRIREVR